ncbi:MULTISPECIES: hypothetical protein [unclassified Cyanobium]|uniref:hypothetical protein n=1 Tax=unclassified Cyanobium TaxID=2627006 RepID=UPI0020CE9BD0|nr:MULTISPECIES: hypothetical protein [unclassified Cyanobium]MCP9833288.1 hypothetical protein [Cyanobium sp. La Preciosa 7G6]MCP9935849.1 hypothetical protein [Cyanobium sp. Aljojuca 7A6]
MARFRCPTCRHRPLRLEQPFSGVPRCGRRGDLLEPKRRHGRAWGLALGVAALVLGGAAFPALLEQVGSLPEQAPEVTTRLLERFEPAPDPRLRPRALLEGGLLASLQEADRQWIPTAEPLAGGGTRFLYWRRAGEPELSVDELQALIDSPPDHGEKLQAIADLLSVLEEVGVQVQLVEPRKTGAAGEWDHAARTLRIKPAVVEKGTVDFAQVLNHEAIHVAQSCAAGGLRAVPRTLGLGQEVPPELRLHLDDPLYAGASDWEKALEREAYANQRQLEIGTTLIRTHCRTRSAG